MAEDENYPSKPSKKRYDTTFQSLAESLEGSSDIDRHPSQSLVGKSTKPDVVWLEGVLDCFNASFPYDADDQRRLGFVVGQQIVGLYLAEMLLKYALDHSGVSYDLHHNLHREEPAPALDLGYGRSRSLRPSRIRRSACSGAIAHEKHPPAKGAISALR